MSFKKFWEKWDAGEYTYSEVEQTLLNLKGGEPLILNHLKNCTVCPVDNGTCTEFFKIIVYGFHPDKPLRKHVIKICPLGVKNIHQCVLSK